MASALAGDDHLRATVEGLKKLSDDDLLQAWAENEAVLRRNPADGHSLRQRHFAFRIAAVERFGAVGHIERWRVARDGARRELRL
jgi:hypothetical protein